ncbi:MAG: beta-ketoacyl-[acyl-carrier-protein] synthase family protein [Gammaproteobacteria bacterium]
MTERRVAVTGLGIVSPLGNNVTSSWNQLMARQSGIAPIQQFDASGFPTHIAAEVKAFQPDPILKTKHNRFASRFVWFGLDAALQALRDAQITPGKDGVLAQRFGVVAGTGMMTLDFDSLLRFHQICVQDGKIDWSQLVNKSQDFYQLDDFAKPMGNSGLSSLIQQFGIEGYATAVHTACASSGQALGLAMEVIRRGDADYMLAGGFDSMISPFGLSSFCLLGALSSDNIASASRPFDLTRNGFILGEGAAFLVLENWAHAKARGARIYAELAGEGNTLSSYRITDSPPDGNGALQAIERALKDAKVTPADVDYINAHGTSTKMNDLSETNAIKAVFGKRAYHIPVSSTKSQTGHLIAAAGALEAAFSVLAIHHARIPMTANLQHPDPECDLDYVTDGPCERSLGVVLSNSFGFGGSNSCLLFKHPEFGGAA